MRAASDLDDATTWLSLSAAPRFLVPYTTLAQIFSLRIRGCCSKQAARNAVNLHCFQSLNQLRSVAREMGH